MGETDPLGPPSGGSVPPFVTYLAMIALLVGAVLVAFWEYLMSLYFLMALAWLVVAGGLAATPLFRGLSSASGLRLTMVVLGVAVAWRFLMLFQDQVLTNDVVVFVGRGQAFLHGVTPYTDDLTVNKPPGYLLLAAGMGATVGPSLVATRTIMSLVDSLVAVLIFWLGEERFSRSFGLMAGLLYAINPISAITIGISGHYDPWPVLFALGGVWLMLRHRLAGASLLLGVGFALKLYPIVLLPWVLLAERSWPRRVGLVIVFAIPMALAWAPILVQNPDAIAFYLDYQGSWEPKGGIAHGIVTVMGIDPASDLAVVVARAVEVVFYVLLAVMFIDWVRRREVSPDAHLLTWFKMVTVGFVALYGAILVSGLVEYEVDIGIGNAASTALLNLLYIALAAVMLWWAWTRWLPGDHGFEADDRMVMLAALSVNLLLLGSAQYNAWYLLWLLPLVLLVRSWRIRDLWNALLVWRAEGKGFTIIPGSDLGPK
ncbi:MAG: DUF2029 domain-containing protein [Thermoplasmata archaeon]|nr:MAG: DUF2029 domain-containing protein [Thermoplasmata archaeon]